MREHRVITAVLATTVAAAACFSGSAGAKPSADQKALTFSGQCQFHGTLRQNPPLTNFPAEGQGAADAVGTCDGTLVRSKRKHPKTYTLDDAPVVYRARATGEMSCGGGTSQGAGTMLFEQGALDFAFSEVRGPGAAAIELEGRYGGSAQGAANVSSSEDPVAIAAACSGPGLSQVEVDISLVSDGLSG
ncbi:MAG: hypothetical protein M3340_09730 [Actinomycetota bacterium]|nr:hypothetical protein [Actinomycetota bacterium]